LTNERKIIMKKILFLSLAFFMYAIDCCSDLHRFTVIKDEARQEKTFFSCNNNWYYTEIRYNVGTNEPETIAEKVEAENGMMDFIIDKIAHLSTELSERMPTLVSLLDQETKDFLYNKEFVIEDNQIFILILNKNDELIELIKRQATPEERKICIKIKAREYAIIKKALADRQSVGSKSLK
jgi:hypothetical protein